MLDYNYEDPEQALSECCNKCCKCKKVNDSPDPYANACDWNKARTPALQPHLMTVRYVCCFSMLLILADLCKDGLKGLNNLWYYLSEWGVWCAIACNLAPFAAQKFGWNKFAIIAHQHSLTLNLIITPLFWIVLAPGIFKEIFNNWSP